MSEFKIEKGIPQPARSGGRYSKYPFREMKVGDSFLAETSDASVIRSNVAVFSRRNPGYKFSTRKEGTGIRVWRIAAK